MFLDIVTQITLPIVAVAGLGFVLQRRLALDVPSLNRLLVHAILPCFLLHHLSSATHPLGDVGVTAWFTVVQFAVLIVVGWGAGGLLGVPQRTRPVLGLAAAFANSGNYGIPLVELAFGSEYILHQAVIVSLHSVLITSLGVLLLARGEGGWRDGLYVAFRAPMIPSVLLGLALRALDVQLPSPIAIPLQVMGSAYAPVALFALGAQLAAARFRAPRGPLALAVGLRLVAAPMLTWIAVMALDLPLGIADMLVVTASAPAGVLLAIVAAEQRVTGDLASAIVFASTVLSPLFVTGVLYAVRLW